jgi:hypothetical protein
MSEREKARVWDHFYAYARDVVGGTEAQCASFADKETKKYIAKYEAGEIVE